MPTMRSLLVACALMAGCSEDDKDDDESKVSAEVAAICMTQCDKAGECDLLEQAGLTEDECLSSCEELNAQQTSQCMFTSAEADDCADGFEAQTCEEIINGVVPEACARTCMVNSM